jgi:hypothetical protein
MDPEDLLLLAEPLMGARAESFRTEAMWLCCGRIVRAPFRDDRGSERYPTLQEKVVVLTRGIVHERPLPKRNEQLAALSMPFFVLWNDRGWTEPPPDEVGTEAILARLAARRLDLGYFVRWVARRIV